MKPKIYIASPYTIGDQALNVRASLEVAEKIVRIGYVPYAPLLTHFWHLMFPHEADYWYEYDLHWVEACDALYRMPGESKGADREVEFACARRIPVFTDFRSLENSKIAIRRPITYPPQTIMMTREGYSHVYRLAQDLEEAVRQLPEFGEYHA